MAKANQLLTPTETAKLLMISPVTLRQWAQKNKIVSQTTLGGHRRFFYADIVAFAQRENITLLRQQGDSTELKRVLIVDDDTSFCLLLTELINSETEQFVIEVAHDGFDAGVKAHQFKPDIVLIDLMLPGINGDEVCRNIKSNTQLKSIRIIGMTGQVTSEVRTNFLHAGAEFVLEKPINSVVLLEFLNR